MKSVLLLVHRIPFPPDKGDKIRSFHILRELMTHFRVYLGTFIDDPHDQQYMAQLDALCTEFHCVRISRVGCMMRSFSGLVQGHSMTTSWYPDKAMKAWVKEVATRHELSAAVAFSSAMAQFLPAADTCFVRVMDFVDLDSAKWRELANKHSGPKKWLYSREAKLVFREEMQIADAVDYSSFVSDEEAGLLRSHVREHSNVMAIRNGIDCEFFDPAVSLESPFAADEQALVFTGAMDYWANVDAVTWFAESVMPLIRQQCPDAAFYIVGSKPTSAVRKLARAGTVVVTGRVPDVRPYLHYADTVVAPLKLARGVQNKVLEAMAMARPLVATSAAIEGIGDPRDAGLRIADTETDFASACVAQLELDSDARNRPALRNYVMSNFSWRENLRPLVQLIASAPARSA